jgi:hypothetical protein
LIEKIGYIKERPAKYGEHSRKNRLITMEMGYSSKGGSSISAFPQANKIGFRKDIYNSP